jgi:hypothetical protein
LLLAFLQPASGPSLYFPSNFINNQFITALLQFYFSSFSGFVMIIFLNLTLSGKGQPVMFGLISGHNMKG